ncbi:MAG: hypothetical protein ABJN84_08945 [Flavobacteriaceae bacterium]
MNRFIGLIAVFAILFLASCEVESAQEQENLVTTIATEGDQTSPKDSKD